jgi:hypothetical protein
MAGGKAYGASLHGACIVMLEYFVRGVCCLAWFSVNSHTACFFSACLASVFEQLCRRVGGAAWCTPMAATALTLLVLQAQNSCLVFDLLIVCYRSAVANLLCG